MNVEIGAEAALFPEKEYINEIFVAVKEKAGASCERRGHELGASNPLSYCWI
jgi:hypothetical protein